MKLEPIAKPIRIRIKLGDSEHSSLDSLKSNFSIKELFPLFKDGRLERWLRQIGEAQLAHRVEDFSKQCGEGEIKDYIQFLSLFFDEVADSLSKYKNNGEWSLNDFLSTASLDTIKIICANTKDLKTKEADKEKIDWADYFGRILSKENVFSIFEDPQLHSVYDDDEWGIELSELVKTDEDYKSIFTYLEMYSRNNQHLEGCKDIIYRFYSESAEKGYRWESVFKDDLSIEYLSNIYQNVCFQILGIDWGTLFAECVKDWEKDHEKIEKIIEGNPHDKISFYNHCAEKGFEEAKMKIDPWYVLANSEDWQIVKKALASCAVNLPPKNRKIKYDNSHISSPLGQEILNFIQFLQLLCDRYAVGIEDYNWKYLKDEAKVMQLAHSFHKNYGWYNSNRKDRNELYTMKEKGIELAIYAFGVRPDGDGFYTLARHAIILIGKKLNDRKL